MRWAAAAARKYPEQVKGFQGTDDNQHRINANGREQQRDGNVAMGGPGSCTIDARRVVKLFGYALYRRDIDDNVEAKELPGRHDKYPVHRSFGITEKTL